MVAIIGRKIPTTGVTGAQADGLGNAFSRIAASFADPLTPALKREKLIEAERQNVGTEAAASALEAARASGNIDPYSFFPAALRGGLRSNDAAGFISGVYGNVHGARDPRTTNALVGEGKGYSQTYHGVQDTLANQRTIHDMTTRRQMEHDRRKYDSEFVNLVTPLGEFIPVPRSEVGARVGEGYRVPMTTDQVKAGVLQRAIEQANARLAPGGSATRPGSVSFDPLYDLPPSTQKMIGIDRRPTPMVDVRGNRYGISYDGGRTVVDQQTGEASPVAGSGWQVASERSAVEESRTALVKNAAREPASVPPWQKGSYAQSAHKSVGVDSFAQQHVNALYGALGLNKAFGAGEVGPDYERARARLGVVNQTILSAFMNSPTSPIKEQNFIRQMLPTVAVLRNPVSEASKVGSLVQYLMDDNQRLRALVASPAITGPDMRRATQALIENEKALNVLTRPGADEQSAPAASPDAPTGGTPAVDALKRKYGLE